MGCGDSKDKDNEKDEEEDQYKRKLTVNKARGGGDTPSIRKGKVDSHRGKENDDSGSDRDKGRGGRGNNDDSEEKKMDKKKEADGRMPKRVSTKKTKVGRMRTSGWI